MMNHAEIFNRVCRHFNEAHVDKYVDELMWRPEFYDGEFDEEVFFDQKLFTSNNVDFYDAGCSKWVISFIDIPGWVFKIPFRGIKVYEEEWDEIDQEYYYTDPVYREYAGAKDQETGWNYCQSELMLYKEAVNHHVEKFFPETYFLGKYFGLEIYMAECAEDYWNLDRDKNKYTDDTSCKSQEICKQYGKNTELTPRYIEDMLVSGAQIDEILDLIFFIKDYEIGDLHGGNVGWKEDGGFCIIDFSDYNE